MNKQNNCTKYREDIAALALGLLESEDTEKLQKHLETCQSCKSLYEAMLNEENTLRSGFQEICEKGEVIQNSLIEKLKENDEDNLSHEKTVKINKKNRFTNHPLIKLATAAVIAIAALLIFNNSSTPAFGLDDVIEALKNAQWSFSKRVFVNNKNEITNTSFEFWRGVKPYRTINLGQDNIIYDEVTLGKQIVYYPKSNTITISYNGSKSERDYESISDLVFSDLAVYKEYGANVTYDNGKLNGRAVMIINVDYSTSSFYKTDSSYTMYVDTKTRLPVRVQSSDKNTKPNNYIVYDFPEKGPENIYEAGAPRDAKVRIIHSKDNPSIFKSQDVPELVNKLTRYNASRDKLLIDYTLITTYEYDSTIRMLDVVYHQGKYQNENQRSISYSARDLAEFISKIIPSEKNFETLLEWSKIKNNNYQNTDIKYNGGFYFSAGIGLNDSWITEGKRNWPLSIKNLQDWGWPEISPKKDIKQIENEYSRENGFIAFERITEPEIIKEKIMNPAEKDIYYLDPSHDYMCVRKEEYKHFIMGGTPIDDLNFDVNDISNEISYVQNVTEFGQTDTGQWYPEKIEFHSKTWDDNGKAQPLSLSFIVTLYLKTNPEFPERLFNPEEPPMPEQEQKATFSGALFKEYFKSENK